MYYKVLQKAILLELKKSTNILINIIKFDETEYSGV